RPGIAALARSLGFALCAGDRADRRGTRFLGHLAPQRVLSVGLHGAGARARRRAVAYPHARLAVSRSPPLHRGSAEARPVIYPLIGCAADERCVIERTETGFVTREEETSAANDWVPCRAGWE